MKKFIVLLLMVAGGTCSMGQSMLKVSLKDNTTQISVSVDDRHFNRKGTSVTVGELPFGTHSLKVYASVYDRRGRGYEEVIYRARIKTYNGMITILVFDPLTGTRDVQEMEIDAYTVNHPATGRGRFSGSSQTDFDSRYSKDGSENSRAINNTVSADNSNLAAVPESNNIAPASPVASPVSAEKFGTLTESKFNKLKPKVAAKTTDTQKMTLLKDELKNEKLTTNQVGDIMDWFIFESSKVDFAKWVYVNTVDKEYFADLESKFAYKTSQDDLDSFIKEQR